MEAAVSAADAKSQLSICSAIMCCKVRGQTILEALGAPPCACKVPASDTGGCQLTYFVTPRAVPSGKELNRLLCPSEIPNFDLHGRHLLDQHALAHRLRRSCQNLLHVFNAVSCSRFIPDRRLCARNGVNRYPSTPGRVRYFRRIQSSALVANDAR
jgi:hypothetical protein